MLSALPSPLLDARGQPLRRGRPRQPENLKYGNADPQDEYTAAAGGSTSSYTQLGSASQMEKLYGNVDDIDIRIGWDAKEQMDNDSHCGAALDTIVLGALARPVEVEPAHKNLYSSEADDGRAIETAEFLRRCLKYLQHSQRDLALTAFSLGRNMLKIGHSKAEIVKAVHRGPTDDRKLVISRIKQKSRANSCFVVDRQNNLLGIAAYTGDYARYDDPYAQTNLSGYMPAALLGAGWKLLPRDKWLVMTNRPGEDDSPLGTSAYRRAYVYYRMKRDVWAFYLKALDYTAMPFTHIDLPANVQKMYLPKTDGTPDTAAGKVDAAYAMYEWAKLARQAGILVTPNDTDVKYLHAAQSGDPFAAAISTFNSEITMAILMQLLATGESRHMARAAGQVHQDILDLAMRYVRRQIADALTRDIATTLIRDNFPVRYHHLVPQFSFGEVELNDFAAWAEAFSKLAVAGLLHPSQFSAIWSVLGLPQADLKELYHDLMFDDVVKEKMMEPQYDAQGNEQPSIYEKYSVQESGKRLTRNIGARRIARSGAIQN